MQATVAFTVFAIMVCLCHGPREQGWFGWGGGWAIRKDDLPPKNEVVVVTETALEDGTASDSQEKTKG